MRSILPGKKPISSSTGTTGRVIIILFTFFSIKYLIPLIQASNVLPVPAGPVAITIGTFIFLTNIKI